MPLSFGLTYDYLCPFARNANEHVVAALDAGADWDVEFVPFSLVQNKVDADGTDVWDRDDLSEASGVLAMAAGLAVRELDPDRFLDVHMGLFTARHDDGRDLNDRGVIRSVLDAAGVDADEVFAAVEDRSAVELLRKHHEWAVEAHEVWGVPTFIAGDRAVFVRLLDRSTDAQSSTGRIEQVVRLVIDVPDLHEFKQTDLPV